jgi:hypothetical protein
VRIALIGPVGKSESQLDRALDLIFSTMQADRAVYFGDPGLVTRRRRPSAAGEAESLWARSQRCIHADPETIERFVAVERRRLDWARLELVPDGEGLCIGLSKDKTLIACLKMDDSDAAARGATVVVYRSVEGAEAADFQLQEADGCVRLTPGNLDQAGLAVVSDEGELSVELYNLRGKQLERRVLSAPSAQ